MNIDQFDLWVSRQQQAVEEALQCWVPQDAPAGLGEVMRYAVLDGGKRLRPLLVLAACEAVGGDAQAAMRAAVAVELIHAYSLVHDDMPCMDDDALRRGKPTVHVQYDEATALLVGDALQAQAFDVLANAHTVPHGRLVWMLKVLAHAAGAAGMCGGQAIDLDSVGLQLTLEQLERMHQLKTGALLRASVVLGALAGADVDDAQMQALNAYARAIGLAFQVVDDVLDATADSATLGKTAGKDAAANKPTYVSILGLDQSKALAEQLRREAHAALEPFGGQARHLRDLADLIVQRNA